MGSDEQNHTPLFELDHVGVEIGGQQILHDLSFTLPDEHISVLLGPSGSGKTTILRLLNRLEVATSGEVRFRDQPIESLDPLALRRRVGMVFQRPTVFPGTGRENLHTASPDASDDELAELLKAADLDGSFLDRVADDLSGGEAQRLCLARALATQPEVLLMDEPTSSLDRDATRYLETTAHSLLDRGLSMVWVTHDLGQAERLAHHHIVICEGRLATRSEMAAYLERN